MENEENFGIVEIERSEIVSIQHEMPNSFGSNILLQILKDKKAPIIGNIYLKPDLENYQWERVELTNSIIFKWKKIKKAAEQC